MHDDDGTCTESNSIKWNRFCFFCVSTQSWPPSALIRVHLIFESRKIETLSIMASHLTCLFYSFLCVRKQQSLTQVKTRAGWWGGECIGLIFSDSKCYIHNPNGCIRHSYWTGNVELCQTDISVVNFCNIPLSSSNTGSKSALIPTWSEKEEKKSIFICSFVALLV